MTNNQLLGIHHVTAMTDDAERNYQFFTEVLGMRLVKKTVNQDDIYTYHTFFADDEGSPGTDMTFFDFPNIPKGSAGTNSITRPSFRVPNDEALEYYEQRFDEFNIKHEGIQSLLGTKVLPFEEVDGQSYQLVSDEHNKGVAPGKPWKNGPVPMDKAIYGLGPIEITVSYFEALYARIGHILIEVSTDGPGFMGDEPYETLGESLALPPFLEPQRAYIESEIRPFDTSR